MSEENNMADVAEDLPVEFNEEEEVGEEAGEPAEAATQTDAAEDEHPSNIVATDDQKIDSVIDSAGDSDLPPVEDEAEEAETIRIVASDETLLLEDEEPTEETSHESVSVSPNELEENITATSEELKPVIESLLFVADEPLPFKQLCKVLGDVAENDVRAALEELVADYEAHNSGLEVREIAGGWRISTRPQNHEFIRKYLKSRPSARLSLPALETLAVIAYKQPITIPEILEIRGVSSSSAIKTLLEKRMIVTKGRKETVGRPMMYGTSKEFLIQFGLKDLSELPSIEDFEDLAQ